MPGRVGVSLVTLYGDTQCAIFNVLSPTSHSAYSSTCRTVRQWSQHSAAVPAVLVLFRQTRTNTFNEAYRVALRRKWLPRRVVFDLRNGPVPLPPPAQWTVQLESIRVMSMTKEFPQAKAWDSVYEWCNHCPRLREIVAVERLFRSGPGPLPTLQVPPTLTHLEVKESLVVSAFGTNPSHLTGLTTLGLHRPLSWTVPPVDVGPQLDVGLGKEVWAHLGNLRALNLSERPIRLMCLPDNAPVVHGLGSLHGLRTLQVNLATFCPSVLSLFGRLPCLSQLEVQGGFYTCVRERHAAHCDWTAPSLRLLHMFFCSPSLCWSLLEKLTAPLLHEVNVSLNSDPTLYSWDGFWALDSLRTQSCGYRRARFPSLRHVTIHKDATQHVTAGSAAKLSGLPGLHITVEDLAVAVVPDIRLTLHSLALEAGPFVSPDFRLLRHCPCLKRLLIYWKPSYNLDGLAECFTLEHVLFLCPAPSSGRSSSSRTSSTSPVMKRPPKRELYKLRSLFFRESPCLIVISNYSAEQDCNSIVALKASDFTLEEEEEVRTEIRGQGRRRCIFM